MASNNHNLCGMEKCYDLSYHFFSKAGWFFSKLMNNHNDENKCKVAEAIVSVSENSKHLICKV